MKRIGTFIIFSCFLFSNLFGQPQREFRATWVATLNGIDWPKNRIANPTDRQITRQKDELLHILDSLQAANMNAVLLQIRPMADAFYPSQLVCWSGYLTDARGKNPTYDPLAFAIEEAHKRGLELHGWMNPYRYTNSSVQHAPTDYLKVQHPEWLLGFASGDTILDPGLPAVRKHIAEVTKEVLVNYPDIDGIVWDDYFYISGITTQDAATFSLYNPQGLSLSDWRRNNVNLTIQEVYDTIQSVNPNVRFGISPRGIWSTSTAAANKYGVTLPAGVTGADNYNVIYCDALAWLSAGIIDYISPQLYWETSSTGQPYGVLAPWWQSIANRYGRHFYSSQALYKGWPHSEIGLQISINRAANMISPGSIFYNTSYFMSDAYTPYLRTNFFTNKTLPPIVSWHSPTILTVSSVQNNGTILSWQNTFHDGSYVIYAVPNSATTNPITDFQYMLTRTWTTDCQFDLTPYLAMQNTHKFAVAAVDRFENLSTPVYAQITSNYHYPEMDKPVIYTDKQQVHIVVGSPTNVYIYTLTGICVYQGIVTGHQMVTLDRGVYIVRSGRYAQKIIL